MNLPKPSNNYKQITKRFSINESKVLGRGCFGEVCQGYDNQTGKIIAIKHLNKPQNFKDQIQTLQKLSTLTHPYIMGFYGYQADRDVYLFIQYCPGGVLTDLIKKGLEQQQALNIFRQIVEGMCYMNAKGIMHRDLKPDNILLGTNRQIKISDFGLARVQDGLQKTGQTGTPLYAGPEIYTNYTDAYNFTCDVWSAGIILHELLTGQLPFQPIQTIYQLKNEWKLFEKGEKRVKYPKDLHPQWEYLTNIMLTYNFKKRPTFHDILQLLKKIDDNGTMRQQIRNAKKGIKVQQNSKQAILQNYLSFIQQKSDILTTMAQKLTPQQFPLIKPALQNLLVFLAMTWYIVKIKNLIRSLKFKNLKYPNKQDVIDRNNPDEKLILVFDRYRNILQVKLTKYQNYLKQKVLAKLQDDEKKPQQLKLLKSVESAYKLYLQVKQGTYDVEETYEQELIKLLSFHRVKPTQQKISAMSAKELQIYAYILLSGLLNIQIPDSMHSTKNVVKDKLQVIQGGKPTELLPAVMKMRSKLQ